MKTLAAWMVGFAVLANTPLFAAEQAPSVDPAQPAPKTDSGEQATLDKMAKLLGVNPDDFLV